MDTMIVVAMFIAACIMFLCFIVGAMMASGRMDDTAGTPTLRPKQKRDAKGRFVRNDP